jgi:hypothetical protein
VRWYFRFQLSLRDIEELLFERGVTVSYETVRRWCDKSRPHSGSADTQQGPIVHRVRCGLAQRTCSGSRATGEKARATRWTWLACPCLMQEDDSGKRWRTDRDLKEVQRQSVQSIAQLAGVPVPRAVNH